MRRRLCLGLIAALCATGARANPSPSEKALIDKLIDAVAQRKDIKFVRNGKDYSSTQAADFLRGKLNWRPEKIATVQDFIEQVGTRSTSTGEIYLVRLGDGHTMPSAEFLRQELKRVARN